MKKNNVWNYSGAMAKIQVIEEKKEDNRINYIVVYFDSLGIPIWKEKHIKIDDKLYWATFSPQSPFIPEINFDPPLPSSPFSTKLGDKKTIESEETRIDSTVTTTTINVQYEIESIENVELPVGLFPECIKLKMTISYPEMVEKPYMEGTSYFWFARGIGPVSYILPSGSGNILSAKIGNRDIP
ncbi:hypothetical protein JXQ31_02270 [candidate division KSB1 bacterium]|nr:hypothetical protein [candidate division KSB1 bacterium]